MRSCCSPLSRVWWGVRVSRRMRRVMRCWMRWRCRGGRRGWLVCRWRGGCGSRPRVWGVVWVRRTWTVFGVRGSRRCPRGTGSRCWIPLCRSMSRSRCRSRCGPRLWPGSGTVCRVCCRRSSRPPPNSAAPQAGPPLAVATRWPGVCSGCPRMSRNACCWIWCRRRSLPCWGMLPPRRSTRPGRSRIWVSTR